MLVTINSISDLVPDPDRDISFSTIRNQIGESGRDLATGVVHRRWTANVRRWGTKGEER